MSTELSFERLEYAQKGIIYSVYGYAHGIHLSKTVPNVIIDIILCFYYLNDEWDKNKVGLQFPTDTCVQLGPVNSYQCGAAFLSKTISQGIASWTFRIVKMCNEVNIGVAKTSFAHHHRGSSRFFNNNNDSYVWRASKKGMLMDPARRGPHDLRQYGKTCVDGDIVDMILNMEERTLSFKINDTDYGVAFSDIEKTEYKAAVFMYAYGQRSRAVTGSIKLIN